MKLYAFDTLAGSSFGGVSIQEVAHALKAAYRRVADREWNQPAPSDTGDVSGEEWDAYVDEIIDGLSGFAPPYCDVCWEDNEVRVLPYIDDELPRFEEIPDDFEGDYCYTVTDHGNVTLWERHTVCDGANHDGRSSTCHVDKCLVPAYRSVWSMV